MVFHLECSSRSSADICRIRVGLGGWNSVAECHQNLTVNVGAASDLNEVACVKVAVVSKLRSEYVAKRHLPPVPP
jgi:hypothetical protein